MKRLICGGTIYDGTGAEPYEADILVEDGRIVAVGREITADAERLDARGCAVTPGFVDMHRHCDVAPLTDPDFGRLELAQGIVATAVGNCGIACVPVAPQTREAYRSFIEPVVGDAPEGCLFESYPAYFQALREARPAVAMGVFAGTGAVKVAVKGFSSAPYTAREMERAQALVGEAMDAGALGVSLGFMYQPECYTTPEEQARVIAPAARAGGLLTAHIRGEGDSLTASVREVIGIAERAGIRLHVSHFKSTGIRNWGWEIFAAIRLIEDARAKGQPVTADFYPYAGGSTTIFSLLPPTLLKDDNAATLQWLATSEGKAAFRRDVAREHAGWDNMALSIGWERIVIASTHLPRHAAYGGRDVRELAEACGYAEPADFVCDLVVAEEGRVGIIVMSMDPRDVDAVARLPYTSVISDALYGGGGNPHPRKYGTFPHFLRDFVAERGVLGMAEAVRKMTSLPAGTLGLRGRGIIRANFRADLNVFVPGELEDTATYADARRLAAGMRRVIIGGRDALVNGEAVELHGGEVLTRAINPE